MAGSGDEWPTLAPSDGNQDGISLRTPVSCSWLAGSLVSDIPFGSQLDREGHQGLDPIQAQTSGAPWKSEKP